MTERFWMLIAFELVFGIGFNAFTAISERKGWIEGYTSLYVVVGVAVTMLIIAIELGVEVLVMLLLAFVASGLPMVVGSITRHMAARSAEKKALLDAVSAATHMTDDEVNA